MKKHELEYKLAALKIPGVVAGPGIKDSVFFTDYYIKFDDNITYNKIMSRKKDLEIFFDCKLTIDTQGGLYIIRTPKQRSNVDFSDFILGIKKSSAALPIVLGVDASGKKTITDLAKMPHLLVAGATGSGKSVFLNGCILSLILSPYCRLCLVDCKCVEFNIYNGLRSMAAPVATTPETALEMLKNLCYTMDKRYDEMQAVNARNIVEYNPKVEKQYGYIVCVIDEINDLLMQDKKRLEPLIIRIAQLGRAAGIHLILATQRPSADCITGLIKSNIPGRVAFSVSSRRDSQIIIDQPGAESLQGRGDGLFINNNLPEPLRFQAANVDTDYINRFLKRLRYN